MSISTIGTFASGDYTATVGGTTPGLIESSGWQLKWRFSKRRIENTSTYGDTMLDGIYRGVQGVQLLVTFREWNAVVKGAIWPYGTAAFDGQHGVTGRLDSSLAVAIVLTATAGTPAAANGPVTLTASKAIVSDQNNFSILLGPDERNIPVLFDLLPFIDSSSPTITRFFTLT